MRKFMEYTLRRNYHDLKRDEQYSQCHFNLFYICRYKTMNCQKNKKFANANLPKGPLHVGQQDSLGRQLEQTKCPL